jgi:HD-GYP domain-containing protein (c-di-GMP phosphodiesterase class II)
MVRMSDILKRAKENKDGKGHPKPEGKRVTRDAEKKADAAAGADKAGKHEFSISKSFAEKSKLIYLSKDECLKLYNEAISLIKDIYNKARAENTLDTEDKDLISYMERFVDQQFIGNEIMLDLINEPPKGNFIYNHAVNVAIIAIEIGIGLGYDKQRLIELGTVSALHDVGMMKYFELFSQPRRFTKKEYIEIKNHAAANSEILKRFKNIRKNFISVVSQEHERVDGSGYPEGLKGDSIEESAQIIGLADMYEALTHARPHRARMDSREALKAIIKCKHCFERRILKALIERLNCPYPLGSCVRLNSGEIGRVVKRNIGVPMRPVVEVTKDAQGGRLDRIKVINLCKKPTIHVKGCHSGEKP